MTFDLICEENHKTYTEEDFDELLDLYIDGDIEDNIITLDSLSIQIYDTYNDNEITSIGDITTIEDMQDLISVLETIESLDDYNSRKLESIIKSNPIDSVTTSYESMDDYDYYDEMDMENVAEELCLNYVFGDDVASVYKKDRNFLDMDYIARLIKNDDRNYVETDYGVLCDA